MSWRSLRLKLFRLRHGLTGVHGRSGVGRLGEGRQPAAAAGRGRLRAGLHGHAGGAHGASEPGPVPAAGAARARRGGPAAGAAPAGAAAGAATAGAARRRAYLLVRSCGEEMELRSYFYQLLTGTGGQTAARLRAAEEEIDRYIRLMPMIGLVAAGRAFGNQGTEDVHGEDGEDSASAQR